MVCDRSSIHNHQSIPKENFEFNMNSFRRKTWRKIVFIRCLSVPSILFEIFIMWWKNNVNSAHEYHVLASYELISSKINKRSKSDAFSRLIDTGQDRTLLVQICQRLAQHWCLGLFEGFSINSSPPHLFSQNPTGSRRTMDRRFARKLICRKTRKVFYQTTLSPSTASSKQRQTSQR